MRMTSRLLPLALFGGAAIFQACGSVPNDTPSGNELAIVGVIKGNVVYSGPAPCSQNGHIVGNADRPRLRSEEPAAAERAREHRGELRRRPG